MYVATVDRPPIVLTATTDGKTPSDAYIATMRQTLQRLDALVLAAADLILDNYDYDHFKRLGVPDTKLVKDETPEAIAAAVTLESVWFLDDSGEQFELSFTAPWDAHHSFDVEFDDGEPTCCAVNG